MIKSYTNKEDTDMLLTRSQAVNETTLELVTMVEGTDVAFTNTVTDGTANHGYTQFSACQTFVDADGDDCTLEMVVYVDSAGVDAAGDDMSNIDWGTAIANADYSII